MRVPPTRAALRPFARTIFAEMSALAAATGSINLGQGFPDTEGPPEVAAAAADAIRAGRNQYAPGPGVPELRRAVAAHQRDCYGLDYDPDDEVLVTVGATEGIAASLLGLCEPGDGVVVIDPAYDSYRPALAMVGARADVVTLHPPDWDLQPAELRRAVTPRTRLLLLNSPHNPTGKVFGRAELEEIARCCVEHDLVAVTDEVYEHLVFDGEHVPLATLPGMRERTVLVSSAAKTFSFTGWKVGWACAPAPLLDAVRAAKQYLTFVGPAPLQLAVARGLAAGSGAVTGIAADLRAQRDLFCAGLRDLGVDVRAPASTYFVTTGVAPFGRGDALGFCRALPGRCGVVAVPTSAFYGEPAAAPERVRWAFCKRPEVLEEALARLATLV